MNRIRVYSWGGIGDAIMFTPVLRALRDKHPQSKIFLYYTNDGHRDVFLHSPWVDQLRPRTKALSRAHQLLRLRGLVAPLGDARPSILYNIHASKIMGEMIGVEVTDPRPQLFLSEQERTIGCDLLAKLKRPCIALHTTSAFANKNWFQENWERVVAQFAQCTFVQVGRKIERQVRGAVDFRGTSLRVAFSIIRQCDALLAVDSAMAHAAAAFRVPSTVLFGPSSASVYGHTSAVNVCGNCTCLPCLEVLFGDACPFENRCMRAIGVDMVCKGMAHALSMPRNRFGDSK